MAGEHDDAVIKVVSVLKLGYDASGTKALRDDLANINTLAQQAAKMLKESFKGGGNQLATEAKRAAQESAAMWKQHGLDQARTAKEIDATWAQVTKEQAQRDRERLRQGLDVEKQLATEARKRAQESQQSLRAQAQAQQDAQRLTQQDTRLRLGAENSLPTLQAQLAAVEARTRVERVGDQVVKDRLASLRQETGELQRQLTLDGQLAKEDVARVAAIKQQVQALNSQVSTLASDKRGTFTGNLSAMPLIAKAAAVMGGMSAVRSALTDIADVELKMTELTRVINDPLLKVDDLRKSLFSMGEEFGFSFQKVQGVMFEWASAGYSLKDSLEATRNSLLALNSAELTTEQATNSMVGILKQWNLTVKDLPMLLDLVSITSDRFSIQSKDVVDALLRSSGAAKNANLTLKETIAIITTMKEATGQAGAAIGTAFNSIINFFSRDKSLNILEKSGIATFADASTKKLRPLMDVLKDLAGNWDKLGGSVQADLMADADAAGLLTQEMAGATGSLSEWNDMQKRDLLTAGANAQRRNYLLGLLKNFTQVYEVLKVEEEAHGYTQQKSAQIMQTYTKHVEQLKTALQELGFSLAADGGLLDGLKGVAGFAKSLVDGFNALSPAAKQAVIAIAEIAGFLAILNTAAKGVLGAGLFDVGKSVSEWAKGLSAAREEATKVAAAAKAAQAANIAAGAEAVAAAQATAVAEETAAAQRIAAAGAVADAKLAAAQVAAAAETEAYMTAATAETAAYTVETEAAWAASAAATAAHQAAATAADVAAAEASAAWEVSAAVQVEASATVAASWQAVSVAEAEAATAATTVGEAATVAGVGVWAAMAPLLVIAVPLAALGAAMYIMNNNANALQDTFKRVKEESDGAIRSSEAQVKTHSANILMVQKLADEYRTLEKTKRAAHNLDETAGKDAGDKQKEITAKIKEALGEETAARLEAARYSETATQAVIDAEKGRRDEVIKALDVQMAKYRESLREQIQTTITSIETIAKGERGWNSFLNAWDAIGRGFHLVMFNMKTAWFSTLAGLSGALADFLASQGDIFANNPIISKIPGMKDFGGSLYTYSSEVRDFSKAMLRDKYQAAIDIADYDAKLTKTMTGRQHKLLADLREELNKLSADTTKAGTGDLTITPPGEHGDPNAGKTMTAVQQDKALAKSIMDKVQALQAEGEATQSLLDLTRTKYDFHTRDKATTEDLTTADKERATVLDLLIQRQTELHVTAEAARNAYDALGVAQSRLNRSTEEGNNAWEEMQNQRESLLKLAGTHTQQMGQLSNEWWGFQKQREELQDKDNAATTTTMRNLDSLKKLYDEGRLSVDQYAFSLQQLAKVQGVAAEATRKLHEQEAAAYKTQFTEQIKASLTSRQEAIKAQIAVLENAIAAFDKVGSGDERKTSRTALTKAFDELRGIASKATVPDSAGITSLIQSVMDKFANFDMGALSPEAFAQMMGEDLATLRGFAGDAQDYLTRVADATEARLKSIGNELKQIDADLKTRLKELQGELDALDAEKKQSERDKATTDHNKSQQSLQDQINYYLMKGEEKYRFEIAALRAQQATEEKKWSEEQTNWKRDDKRKDIQDRMETARQDAQHRKDLLETERADLQERQRLMNDALKALQTYVNSEIATRKKALEARKKDLEENAKVIDEQLKKIDEKVVGALAKLASQGAEGYKNAQSLINRITAGIRDGLPALQSAVDAVNSALNSAGGGGTTPTPAPGGTTPPPTGGGGGGHGGHRAFAEGGFVKGGRGGVRALIGEGKPYTGDEVVFTRQHAVPLLSQAMATVMRSGVAPAGGVSAADVVGIVKAAVREVIGNLPDINNYVVVDGVVIDKRVLKMFGGLGHEVSGM